MDVRRFLVKAAAFVFPHDLRCNLCNTEVCVERESGLCPECRKKLVRSSPFTKHIAKVSQVDTGFDYRDPIRQLIHRFKFRNEPYLAKTLARLLWDCACVEMTSSTILVPVPLHPQRLKERGYSQTLLLCRELHVLSGAKVLDGALIRSKYGIPQTELSPRERQKNVQDAFFCNSREVTGLSLTLVDDIVTTGATAESCALALYEAGASEVSVLALCGPHTEEEKNP